MAKATKTPSNTAPPPGFDWSKATATGFENTRQEDLGIPFLMIVQKGSPEVDKTHPEYQQKKIAGISVGDVFNTMTREILYKEDGNDTIDFVPCQHQRLYVEWQPREKGGGFVRQHTNQMVLSECKRNEKGQDQLPSGNIIVTTSYFAGFVIRDGKSPERVVISLTSTQLKKARLWLNIAMGFKMGDRPMPFFSHKYSLSTVAEQNEKGSWYGWVIEAGDQINDAVLIASCMDVARQTIAAAPSQQSALKAPVENDDVPM